MRVLRLLLASLALHAALAFGLGRLAGPSATSGPRAVEIELASPPPTPATAKRAAPQPEEARPASKPAPPRTARARPADPPRPPATTTPPSVAAASATTSDAAPASVAPPITEAAPRSSNGPATEPRPAPPKVDLFSNAAVARAAGVELSPSSSDRGFRPRRGVGGDSRQGGVDVASFLAEDAARMRVDKGAVAPELRRLEKRLHEAFAPTFAQADNSNRAELFLKQFRGFLKNPPKTGELARTLDPTKETLADKLRSARPDQAFFLGRRIEIFVRQAPDGTIREIAIRNASGYKAFDEAALAAVEKALAGHLPAGAGHEGDVRTLWQLDATAYVVISPQPELVFDEASGKSEWVYPLQKRIDKAVHLIAVY